MFAWIKEVFKGSVEPVAWEDSPRISIEVIWQRINEVVPPALGVTALQLRGAAEEESKAWPERVLAFLQGARSQSLIDEGAFIELEQMLLEWH